jgi:hypothetical protein
MSSMNNRLVYERDSWYDEYVDDYEDDGSVVYSDGSEDRVRTMADKDEQMIGVK